MPAGGGEVAVPVGDDWGPGAYVTVMLYRPMDEKAKRMPSRAIGLRWLAVDQAAAHAQRRARRAARRSSPARTLTVPVKVDGLGAGEEARVTVAAVDVGILNLTRFETPEAGGLVLRPAPARHRDPRPLRPPDRRHARRARQAALRRRRRRRHGHAGQPAGRGDAGAVLRHRQGRRRRHGQRRVRAARLQRHGAPDGRGVERRQARLRPART